MPSVPRTQLALLAMCSLLASCATFATRDALQVTVAGFEPLQGEGFEMRMNVRLRVQNPNDEPLEYDGVALQMAVQGKTFATGVSDITGTVPRFGEAVITVPMTISALSLARQAMGMMNDRAGAQHIEYEMKGKLSGIGARATRFTNKGQFDLPTTPTRTTD